MTPTANGSEPMAALHRLFAFIAGVPADLFYGCGFPACGCTVRCLIHDLGRREWVRVDGPGDPEAMFVPAGPSPCLKEDLGA